MEQMTAVGVAVENTAYHFDKEFTYFLPPGMQAAPGCRVMVPFGSGNRGRQGMILSLQSCEQPELLKPVTAVLDQTPLLSAEQLRMVPWLKERYFCSLFDAVKLLLPAGINFKISTQYVLAAPKQEFSEQDFSETELLLLSRLSQKAAAEEELLQMLDSRHGPSALERLCSLGVIRKESAATRRIGDAMRKMIRLTAEEMPDSLSPKQREVFELLLSIGCVSVKELCYFAGVTVSVPDALVKKGLASYYEEEQYRNPYEKVQESAEEVDVLLSPEQQAAYEGLLGRYRSGAAVSLLYGVTGSGKTQVYLRLIEDVVADGRGVIVMVPEISLTPQTVALFHQRYGKQVAVFHSGLSLGERLDEWKRVKNGQAKIVVGTRSAVFAPFERLGLIVMDEEQEATYKSESAPRYHARDVAKFRCAYHKALLLLCSATPSVETTYFAQKGRYSMYPLPSRYGPAELPQVTIADMNQEILLGNSTVFSGALKEALTETLAKREQAILLLNRRGYHTFATCKACNTVVSCPNCSISLTYHAANHRLMCHYCGYSVPATRRCPSCGQDEVRFSGAGTQRAEEQLAQLFPQARVLRLDTDSTMGRFSYEKKLSRFENGEYDIIVGTQMVAKGLDFANVTLVGVLSADQSLYGDDFRCSERSFDLLTQVVGRSGRGSNHGRAIIQTFTPESSVIRLAAAQDYGTFYREEIQFRQAMLYPPFADFVLIGFVGQREEQVCQASLYFMNLLRNLASREYSDLPLRVLDPSPALVTKVSNKYRYQLLIKCRNDKRLRAMLSRLFIEFSAERRFAQVTAFVDTNPVSAL